MEGKRQGISRGPATASRHVPRIVQHLLSHPSSWGTFGDKAAATTAARPGVAAGAIRSQLRDTGQELGPHER